MTVSLDDAKAQLNLTTDDDSGLVMRLITAAQDWLETQLGYKLADRFTTGSPATLNVPPALDHCQLMMIGHFYANREATLVGVSAAPLPLGVCEIVNDWRDWSWGEADD
ncbi:MAG TPA: head-tail connector protein [Nitrobacter sp.]|nr:head-tail connector protein [Nitrobacter sp.]